MEIDLLSHDLIIAGISGGVAGLIAWGGVRRDIAWLKDWVKGMSAKMVTRDECRIMHFHARREDRSDGE